MYFTLCCSSLDLAMALPVCAVVCAPLVIRDIFSCCSYCYDSRVLAFIYLTHSFFFAWAVCSFFFNPFSRWFDAIVSGNVRFHLILHFVTFRNTRKKCLPWGHLCIHLQKTGCIYTLWILLCVFLVLLKILRRKIKDWTLLWSGTKLREVNPIFFLNTINLSSFKDN